MKYGWLALATVILFSGCSLMNKIAPSHIDETGATLPGTHTLTPFAQTATDATGPYGQAAVASILLVWNFVERFKAKKSGEGLKATLAGLSQAAKDPDTKAAFEQVKLYLKNAHDAAGVRKEIDLLLAKM